MDVAGVEQQAGVVAKEEGQEKKDEGDNPLKGEFTVRVQIKKNILHSCLLISMRYSVCSGELKGTRNLVHG